MAIKDWGNTKFGEYIGAAAIIVAIGLGASFFMKGCSDAIYRIEEIDKIRAETKRYETQTETNKQKNLNEILKEKNMYLEQKLEE